MQFSGHLNCYQLPLLTKTILICCCFAFILNNGYLCFKMKNVSSSNISKIDLLNNENVFLFRFFKYFDQVNYKLSNSCQESYSYFRKHSSEKWAMKSKSDFFHKFTVDFFLVIDANSVIESGRVIGNIQFFGQFDECIDLIIETGSLENNYIQYCTIHFPITVILDKNQVTKQKLIVTLVKY